VGVGPVEREIRRRMVVLVRLSGFRT